MPARAPLAKFAKSADGLEIYAEAAGDPTKPHVVFVHGFTFSSVVWDAQFSDAKLLDNIFAVRYDLRGHGRTGKPAQPEAWVSKRMAEDFDAVVKAFNLQKPTMVGWSYGATMAADIVNAFGPNYLSGLVYVGALAYTPDERNLLYLPDPITLRLQSPSTPEENQQLLAGFLEACWTNPLLVSVEIKKSWLDAMFTQSIEIRKPAASRTQDKRGFWKKAGPVLPVLVIHGKQDRICPHDALVDEVKLRFQHLEISSFSGVGHVPFVEKASEFNKTILRWIEKTKRD